MGKLSKEDLRAAIQKESIRFEHHYRWIEEHMPASFFDEVDPDTILLIAHSLMRLDVQDYFSHIHLKHAAVVLCLDAPDADLRILKHYRKNGIKNYRAFVSNEPPPFSGITTRLRIGILLFTSFAEKQTPALDQEKEKEILELVKARNPEITEEDFHKLLLGMSPRFLRALTKERLILALDMYFRAQTRDHCQYEVRYNEDWQDKPDTPSMQIVFAWRNVPKFNFLYRLAKVIHRHNLTMKRVNATYIDPYSRHNILIMSVGIHGRHGKAAWEEADLVDFLREFATLKYFEGLENIEQVFVDSGLISGNLGNLIKTMTYFIHQSLVHADVNIYAFAHIEEGLCRHPELTLLLAQSFEAKFHPEKQDPSLYRKLYEEFLKLVENLDTGHEIHDTRRKNILRQGIQFVDHTLKTNFYRNNKTAFSFRLDPAYLNALPYEREEKFPELPFALFFMKGMHFIGFHIRFRDLSRGGLRTVCPEKMEQMVIERNNVFAECYGLAYTQQKKNKDIPEGGAKGVIFLEPYEQLLAEEEIYIKELEDAGITPAEIEHRMQLFRKEQKQEYLFQIQRAYIESFITLINCDSDGSLKAKHIIDYWKKPEYIYLGPDENMSNGMIEWIASYSKQMGYKPAGSFISSKPSLGINHKEFGVTSLGVNVYMEEVLKYLKIDPKKDPFTIKVSGGPDGDVAGNQILNLYRHFPKTAKLLALTDVSGTIFDPNGLNLEEMAKLFLEAKPIRFYPPAKLSEGGFLLDLRTKREQTSYAQQTLCWRKVNGKLVEDWLSGNEMNQLLRNNLHQTPVDIFIPGGGRPRTLSEHNWKDFLDPAGKPTAKAIVEGANLYLTPAARRELEKLGVIIIKDSSANKGGVICSSFEVLAGLTLSEEEFLKEKTELVQEILTAISSRAREEATLLLRTFGQTDEPLTQLSERVSEKINAYTDDLQHYLAPLTLSKNPGDPLIRALLGYCPPLLRKKYQDRILNEIPDVHQKAIIACYIASRLVYSRGLAWSPSLIDVLPLIEKDPHILP